MDNNDATTNALVDVVNITKDTTGTPAAGIGMGSDPFLCGLAGAAARCGPGVLLGDAVVDDDEVVLGQFASTLELLGLPVGLHGPDFLSPVLPVCYR